MTPLLVLYRRSHQAGLLPDRPFVCHRQSQADRARSDVLVIPTRVVPRLTDLTTPELASLITSVQHVGRVIENAYGADSLTVACQDGKAAGQSVPHVHFHILPRKFKGDPFSEKMDDVYPALERSEASLHQQFMGTNGLDGRFQPLTVDADDKRQPRSLLEMEKEAEWLRAFSLGPHHDS